MRESKTLIPYEASLTLNSGDRYNAAYLMFISYQWTLSEKWLTSSKSNGYNGWYITFLFARRSFNSNKSYFFSLISILKLIVAVEWLKITRDGQRHKSFTGRLKFIEFINAFN